VAIRISSISLGQEFFRTPLASPTEPDKGPASGRSVRRCARSLTLRCYQRVPLHTQCATTLIRRPEVRYNALSASDIWNPDLRTAQKSNLLDRRSSSNRSLARSLAREHCIRTITYALALFTQQGLPLSIYNFMQIMPLLPSVPSFLAPSRIRVSVLQLFSGDVSDRLFRLNM
jgi:hypothetical protein